MNTKEKREILNYSKYKILNYSKNYDTKVSSIHRNMTELFHSDFYTILPLNDLLGKPLVRTADLLDFKNAKK